MKHFLAAIAQRVAPRTVTNLRRLNALDPELGRGLPQLISYERELRELRREVDELRRDNRRVAELYDAFYQWLNQNVGSRGSDVDAGGTVNRVANVLSGDPNPARPQSLGS